MLIPSAGRAREPENRHCSPNSCYLLSLSGAAQGVAPSLPGGARAMPRLLRPIDQSQTHGQGKKTKSRPARRQGPQRRRMYRMGSGAAAAEGVCRPAARKQAEMRRARAAPRLVSGWGSGDGCTGWGRARRDSRREVGPAPRAAFDDRAKPRLQRAPARWPGIPAGWQ